MNFAITVLAFIVALGVLIVFHEFGHYVIARLFGVKVLRFSIGFGRALWRTRRGQDQTEWVIAALPLGGYVKMLDEREGPVAPEEAHRAFNRQNVWRRMAIVAAGPVANFLLAIVFYWALFVGGVQEAKPVVGAPDAAGPEDLFAEYFGQPGGQVGVLSPEPLVLLAEIGQVREQGLLAGGRGGRAAGRGGGTCVDLGAQVVVTVEERPVDAGGPGDAGGADLLSGGGGGADGPGDAGAPAGGIGLASAQRCSCRLVAGAGHAARSGRMAGSACRSRGMPRVTVWWRRTIATAWLICSRSASGRSPSPFSIRVISCRIFVISSWDGAASARAHWSTPAAASTRSRLRSRSSR